ncbi:P-loop containing nucleoside triphosphate hydrolase protein [Aspergillus pseudonomiae]|uniref:P-loop containing nucleoside triphosphate hydrolase protein n=1 Tax=Aspergillus pseudonomiae TaxID=1506151 RepID=A0A5N6I0Z2_9EURO|nr:P-loop containing nucleoside triphosphate hydrolase protein [Aspergillus pseudonomiae]KAB8260421.1 P-loop containing nucleoside triphosphate hydrolase protein [Aspergillus pseudonomiae]KAE8409516.1 P-loop containing nucleoside triphosphate hydrolase protein [Aspergillus pseudonomiae]
MMRPKPASSLQKTYDDCYLMCSTAVYFEGQNNEEEALKSWRSALETIYYHNAYRVPSKYTPKNETEKALQDSIRQLELQCRERVDLLEALRESRKDTSGKSPPFTTGYRGWIGEGTVPAVGYTDLSKPPTIPGRPPPPVNTTSSESTANETGSSTSMAGRPGLHKTQSSSAKTTSSRNSSPERRKAMPSTLRNADLKKPVKKKISPRRKDLRPAAASQAAGLAWGSLYRTPSSEKAVSDAALASSRLTVANDPSFRKEPTPPRSKSGDGVPPRRSVPPEDSGEERRSARKLRVPGQTPRRSPAKSTPAPTLTPTSTPQAPAGVQQPSANRTHSASVSKGSNDTVQPRASPRPSVKPKPVALRATYQPPTPSGGSAGVADTSNNLQAGSARTPRRITPASTGEDALSDSIDRMSISRTSPERRPTPRIRRAITPPSSSDPESLGPKSTDADEDEVEVEDEDDAIMDILNKLPKGVDVATARQILNDIVVRGDEVHWDDIAGLDGAKKALKEAVVYPFLRPDLFSGLREPARGMLLFGPPGTGKTMLARAVATESKSTFFSVSASTLTSKWHGESEKLVRALFSLAKALAPSIIFVDEIDSLLSARSSGTENEASRRSKTEFLIQWSDLQRAAAGRESPGRDKKSGGDPSRVLVLAATNMPWDIDEAARRRFVRRQYIPLPEHHVREQQLRTLLSHQVHDLTDQDINALVQLTEGFSGSDITALAKDAAMGPLRNLGEALLHTPMDQIRAIRFQDFEASLSSIRPSVSRDGLREYEDWARQFGERGG